MSDTCVNLLASIRMLLFLAVVECQSRLNGRTYHMIISGLRGEVALNEEVIFSIVNDVAKAFAVNPAALYIKMGRPGCEVGVPRVPTLTVPNVPRQPF